MSDSINELIDGFNNIEDKNIFAAALLKHFEEVRDKQYTEKEKLRSYKTKSEIVRLLEKFSKSGMSVSKFFEQNLINEPKIMQHK